MFVVFSYYEPVNFEPSLAMLFGIGKLPLF